MVTVTIEVPVSSDVILGFSLSDPQDVADVERIIARRKGQAQGVPTELISHVMETKAGRTFVKPVVQAMVAGQSYTAADLAVLLGEENWNARRVASKMTVLGRPEKRFNIRIFERPTEGHYMVTAAMKAAIEAA